jgi:hypothetical protein
MKKQGTGASHPTDHKSLVGGPGRDQRSDGMTRLLRGAIAPVGEQAELPRDLWPEMQRRLLDEKLRCDERAGSAVANRRRALAPVPWFDWALAGGLVLFAVASPVSIPVLLYYL